MKVSKGQPVFRPVVITIETSNELFTLRNILNSFAGTSLKIDNVGTFSRSLLNKLADLQNE